MIYTNKCLDIVEIDSEKRLETVVLHDRYKTIGVESNMHEKIEYLKPGAHKLLTIKVDPANRARLSLSQESSEEIFLVLDLYEFKVFRRNAKLYVPEFMKDNVEVCRKYTLFNKSKSCYWNTFILKVTPIKDGRLMYLKYIDTAGKIRYVTIDLKDNIIKNVGDNEFSKIASSMGVSIREINSHTLNLVR